MKDEWVPLILRCVFGAIAQITISFALKNMPLTLYSILYNTLPFIIAILVFIWLRERISKFELGSMCFCFAGILMVIVFAEKKDKEPEEGGEEVEVDANNKSLTLGVFAAMTAIFSFGVTAVATRRLQSIHFTIILFYYSLIGTIVFSIYSIVLHNLTEESQMF